ncbi:hypothetical protein B296_00003983 [Ensete ventricosum]|uniref:Uncharacterized protein n=1 Tax=Ensete ventricosum TaxID=4639 RepID=A0A427B308_ENSVE|nr:hypothetical protein B296_00003983 [Ensete ventricosum]
MDPRQYNSIVMPLPHTLCINFKPSHLSCSGIFGVESSRSIIYKVIKGRGSLLHGSNINYSMLFFFPKEDV